MSQEDDESFDGSDGGHLTLVRRLNMAAATMIDTFIVMAGLALLLTMVMLTELAMGRRWRRVDSDGRPEIEPGHDH